MKYTAKIEKLPNSQVKIIVSIAKEELNTLRKKAESKVLGQTKMDGFREGKVPLSVFLSKYGEFPILQEMGYLAINETYPEVIVGEKIEVIGRPEIAIEKLAVGEGENFEYSIKVDVLPKIELGDYKTYHSKIVPEEIKDPTEDEVDDAIEELRRMRARKVKNTEGAEEEVLPEINQEFLQSVGNFQTLDELKTRIRDNIQGEKKFRAEEKRKGQILDLLVKEAKVEVPNTLVENELTKIEERLRADLSQMGISFDDYLKHLQKDLPAWKESEKENAKKQVIIQLALHTIAKNENLKVSDETIDHEVAHLLNLYKNIDPERARAYTEERMTNLLVAEYIFTGKIPDEKELFGQHQKKHSP